MVSSNAIRCMLRRKFKTALAFRDGGGLEVERQATPIQSTTA